MKMLSQEELVELRQDIETLGIPEDRAIDLINFIDAIVMSFIDQDIGLDPVLLSLSARANYAFAPDGTYDILRQSKTLDLIDPGGDVGIDRKIPTRPFTP